MTRILLTIATLSLILVAAAFLAGLSIGDIQSPLPSEDTLLSATVHRLTGLAAALAVVFVESIVVTYFIGTSRWVKEVVETYHFDPELVRESNRLKRRTFPWALMGMLTVVGVISLGARSDPSTRLPDTQAWAIWHLAGAIAGTVFIAWTYLIAWNNIAAHHAIIEQLVAEVGRVRRERGLDQS